MSTIRVTNFQHASASDPAIVLAADGSATANVSAINGGPLAGMRNAIINGNFDIWQRGTSFTESEYGADRWNSARNFTTHTVTRQAFTIGQTDVPGEPIYFHRTVVSSVAGAGSFSILVQPIEDVRTFAGQQVTVSFWAKADAAKPISVELVQSFGTGGSPSAEVTSIGTTKVSIGTTFQKVTVTATMPSISGKTLGTNTNSSLNLNIWFDAGSNFNARTDSLGQQSGTFDIAQVQIEAGPVATPFERRSIGTELALCQRYYEVFSSPTTSASFGHIGQATSGSTAVIPVKFHVVKRAAPTFSQSGTWIISIASGGSAGGTLTLTSANLYIARLFISSASSLTAGHATILSATTTDATLEFNAEL